MKIREGQMTPMNQQFFSVSHNSSSKKGFPWVSEIVSGVRWRVCRACEREIGEETGDITASLMRNKGTKWPDVLGSGSRPLFIVSERVLDAFSKEGVGDFPTHRFYIKDPLPKTMKDQAFPAYYWFEGRKMKGALLDFRSSGIVDPKICPECKNLSYNVAATYELEHSKLFPYTFSSGSWKGANFFTTDLSYAIFFCTDAVLECARKYKLTNFRFIPVEQGDGYWTEPVKYM